MAERDEHIAQQFPVGGGIVSKTDGLGFRLAGIFDVVQCQQNGRERIVRFGRQRVLQDGLREYVGGGIELAQLRVLNPEFQEIERGRGRGGFVVGDVHHRASGSDRGVCGGLMERRHIYLRRSAGGASRATRARTLGIVSCLAG